MHVTSPGSGIVSNHQGAFVTTANVATDLNGSNHHNAAIVVNQDMRAQLEQSMQRSVTLVFWHKVGFGCTMI